MLAKPRPTRSHSRKAKPDFTEDIRMATRVNNLAAQDTFIAPPGKAFPLSAAREGMVEKLRKQKAAQEFASLLYLEVIKAMRATVPADGLFEKDSLSQDLYSTLADVEVARAMVKREGVGLTKFIEKAMAVYDRPSVRAIPREPLPSRHSQNSPHRISEYSPTENAVTAMGLTAPQLTDEEFGRAAVLPVAGRITSQFGVRHDPLGKGDRWHKGIDIAAPAGTPVQALAAGKVVFSGRAGSYGNLVEIDHGNGFTTRYAHNQTLLVTVGDIVPAGKEIAQVGSTGRSTGPHLHLEIRKEGHAVDPLALIANFPSASRRAGLATQTVATVR